MHWLSEVLQASADSKYYIIMETNVKPRDYLLVVDLQSIDDPTDPEFMANVSDLQPALPPQVQTSSSEAPEKNADVCSYPYTFFRSLTPLLPVPRAPPCKQACSCKTVPRTGRFSLFSWQGMFVCDCQFQGMVCSCHSRDWWRVRYEGDVFDILFG